MKMRAGLFIAVLLGSPNLVPHADAATLSVPGSYPTIQAAVDAAAPHGDVIEVDAGVYAEDVSVSAKDVSIIGIQGLSATTVRSFHWVNPLADTQYESGMTGILVQNPSDATVAYNFALRQCELLGSVVLSVSSGYPFCRVRMENCICLAGARVMAYGTAATATVERCTVAGSDVNVQGNGTNTVRNCTLVRGAVISSGGADHVLIQANQITGSGAYISVLGSAPMSVVISGNTLTYASGGISASSYPLYSISIQNNKLFWCNGGITAFTAAEMRVEGNQLLGCLDGISTESDNETWCTGNSLISCGYGLIVGGYFVGATVQGNSVSQCTGDGLRINPLYPDVYELDVSRNVVAGCGSGARFLTLPSNLTIGCNDVWNNSGGNWIGTPDPSGTDGNFSSDPLFCIPTADLSLAATSPCLPGNHPDGWDCGRIGAYDQGCLAPGGETAGEAMDSAGGFSSRTREANPVFELKLPNPYRADAGIILKASRSAPQADLLIFDVEGTCVRHLWRGTVEVGATRLTWDGRSDSGAKVPAGRYFLRARCGSMGVVRSIILIE